MCVRGCVFVSSYSCAKVTDFTYCLEFQEKKENKEKKRVLPVQVGVFS